MGVFNLFEQNVVESLCRGVLSSARLRAILDGADEVSCEVTGQGYFLVVRHPQLPSQRIVCSTPNLVGRVDGVECGFVVFLEGGELTLECYTWEDGGLPADFRERDVRVEEAA